ncbi:MAG: arginase family protein [candidate division WOR-3 bacterium]|nr:arginase family protein [candidate division WOR-3 bacterium]MCX7948322.1 arginase family protein [candidate division WOR-3 bacterium]MDW8150850.1 arginase family protein [candidate division WOR-3 bacterium]
MINVLGICYEGKENFLKGTRIAPGYIRWAIESIEDTSIYQDNKSYKPYNELGDIHVPWEYSNYEVIEFISERVEKLIDLYKMPFVFIGGDHFITYPVVKIISQYIDDFAIIHLDAHLDRRDIFEGSKYNHATFIRRLEEEGFTIYTLGYRSFASKEEYINERCYSFKVLEPLEKIINNHSKFYLTIDLDVLDPSIFPSVSNPEPNGISTIEIIHSIKLLRNKIISADIVEFSPMVSDHYRSGVIASIILRELIISMKKV